MNIKELRKQAGLTQDQLATESGVNKFQISKIERGTIEMKNVSFINALRLCKALGVDPFDMIDLEEKEEG